MGVLFSTYYGFIRVNEAGPQIKGWAVTDTNWDAVSKVLKGIEQHQHGGATPILYPGYNYATPATPIYPTLTEVSPGGFISPGTIVGVRLSFVNALGLETTASPEIDLQLAPIPDRPNAPVLANPFSTPVPGAIPGGTYVYALTKRRGSGETLISNTSVTDVPFDPVQSYVVPVTFNAISGYTDGTDSLLLYRAQGYNSAFQLLTTVTNTNQTAYSDDGTVQNISQSPPAINQFNKNKKVHIDWSAISVPGSAQRFRVYITQSPNLWGSSNLLADYDLSTPLPGSMDYLGNEVLSSGYPNEFSQIPGNPPKVYLNTQTYGAPYLTEHMDFQGWHARRIVLANNVNNATPMPGALYYESTAATPQVRAYIGSPWNSWQALVAPTGTYTHPSQEQGGHSTDNVLFKQLGGPTLTNIINVLATPVQQFRKPVTKVYKPTATPVNLVTASTTGVYLADMDTGVMSVDFGGQWCEVNFNGHFQLDSAATASVQLEIDGIKLEETIRSFTTTGLAQNFPISIHFATPASVSTTRVKVLYWTSGGNVSSIAQRRSLVTKVLF